MSTSLPQKPSFSFHIDSESPHTANTVPAAVLVQVLQGAQLAFEHIGIHVEGRSIKSRARVSALTSRRFQLICKLPEPGCYAVPVEIGDTTDLLQEEHAAQALSIFEELMRNISAKSSAGIVQALPDERVRRRVLEAVKGMAPRSGANWKLSLHDSADVAFADIDRDTVSFVQQTLVPIDQREASRVITGELTNIDFVKRVLTMIYPPTNKLLDCTYDETLEDMLYEQRRNFIQVTGRVILDEHGEPRSIFNVSDIVELDLSPIEIVGVEYQGLHLRAHPLLSLEVVTDESKQLLCVQDMALGLNAFAGTRDALLQEIWEQVAMLWTEYALANDDELDGPTLELKHALRVRFSGINHAA
jgi:hypothetical protein